MNEEIKDNDETQEVGLENRDIEALFFEPLGLSTETLVDIAGYETDEFAKGIKEASKECGMFTAYLGVGMTNVQAYDLILTKLTLEYQKEINNVSNNAQIEVSKNQNIMVEKTQL